MDGNKFWIRIWAMVISGVVIVAFVIAAHSMGTNRIIAEMVKDGASPIEASIALAFVDQKDRAFYLGSQSNK